MLRLHPHPSGRAYGRHGLEPGTAGREGDGLTARPPDQRVEL